jgi:hypothetical protein
VIWTGGDDGGEVDSQAIEVGSSGTATRMVSDTVSPSDFINE